MMESGWRRERNREGWRDEGKERECEMGQKNGGNAGGREGENDGVESE